MNKTEAELLNALAKLEKSIVGWSVWSTAYGDKVHSPQVTRNLEEFRNLLFGVLLEEETDR